MANLGPIEFLIIAVLVLLIGAFLWRAFRR